MKVNLWKFILLIVGLLMFVGGCSADKLSPDNPKGKEIYYTVITGEGTEGDSGRYNYEVLAYDEDAKEKEIEFSASYQLREGAYIQLYRTKLRGVTHWEEVSLEELPEAVQPYLE
ncbi:membrane protein [Bacillus sp. J14TS2]|uniref:YxeA family protein n=1 Tax=Bacillus sp. J14TS2 TaxID=2807188 RepID=UPI001B181D9F|nr:YxeA family protein [Bacillus sp. J14TS2]GIN73288.1 membrane protein [Bacillus sp. J14TS2]